MAGLFDTFTIAKRGLFANQSMINTTAHNISNSDTDGYSRQRSVAETTKPFGGTSRFDTCTVGQVGTGVQITAIQRIRDYFVDYQVRNETGKSGYYTQTNDTLSKVEDIFGEPSDKGIQELTSKFFNSFQEVAKNPDKSDVKTVAIQNASTLADALNYTYNQLEQTCKDSQSLLQTNVTDVNNYLNQINDLNKQIRSVSAVGETANDLMDKRDNLLDELSNKFGITVDRDNFDTINVSSTEYPNSPLVKSDPNDTGYSRLSYVKSATAGTDASGDIVTLEYYPMGSDTTTPQTVTINVSSAADAKSLEDELNQCRILITDNNGIITTKDASGNDVEVASGGTIDATSTKLTDFKAKIFQTYKYDSGVNSVDNNNIKGDIAANQAVQENIKGYMDNLDRLAAAIGYSVNAIQNGSINEGSTSQGLTLNDVFVTYNDTTKTNNTTDTGLTAKNIRVNTNLITDPGKLNCNTTSTSGSGDGARATAIANLSSVKFNLSNITSADDLTTMDRATFLSKIGINTTTTSSGFSDANCLSLNAGTSGSTIDSYYKTVINNVAVQTQAASNKQDTEETLLADLKDQRSAVSGVSLDEETTNLIQYQHAYQANAKMISTIDELLDVVINGLKK